MTADLWALVANTLWGFGLILLEAFGRTAAAGIAWNLGNRDEEVSVPGWVKRTGRALRNHKENFPLFLVAVLVVHLTGKGDDVSAGAAAIYVLARALHGIFYVLGIKVLRTVAWLGGLGAALVVLSQVFY